MISTHFWVTMNDDITKIRSELEKITVECDADWVAFSGGLDSSILAVSYTHLTLPTKA